MAAASWPRGVKTSAMATNTPRESAISFWDAEAGLAWSFKDNDRSHHGAAGDEIKQVIRLLRIHRVF